jgi:hypothetical protein
MITFDAFIAKYTDKPVDYDGIYPNQCMDLMHLYVEEVLGFTEKSLLAAPSASQAYLNYSGSEFQKIDNSFLNVPQKGDILFFGTKVGPYGHVCIFTSGNVLNFKSFDANWPVGSLPHIQDHNYIGVLGWLRKVQVPVVNKYEIAYNKIKEIVESTG